jgi:hypothetical protein
LFSVKKLEIYRSFYVCCIYFVLIYRYRKLIDAWKDAKPPPRTSEEAARLVILTLKGHKKADVEVFMYFQTSILVN